MIDSCCFLSNSAENIAYFEGDMYLDIINTNFSNNKANTIIFVTTSFYDTISDFYDIIFGYYDDMYITTAAQVLWCTFFNNTGGHLMSLNGEYILIIISEVQITHNILIPEYGGLIMFQNYSTIIANITNIEYYFNCIKGDGSGFHFTSKLKDIFNLMKDVLNVLLLLITYTEPLFHPISNLLYKEIIYNPIINGFLLQMEALLITPVEDMEPLSTLLCHSCLVIVI